MEAINCPICETNDISPLYMKNGFNIVKCKICGLIYVNPRPSPEELKEKYAGDYSQGYIDKKESKRKRAKKIVRKICRLKRGGNFLDIGCSAGFILEAARERGFTTFGCEISPIALKFAREELNLNVKAPFLEEANYPSEYFDVITMYNLLEHIPNPGTFLREVNGILKKNGIVEIWTPNIGHIKSRIKKDRWNNLIPPDHLFYFTIKTIKMLLKKYGLKIKKNQFTLKDGLKIYAEKLQTQGEALMF